MKTTQISKFALDAFEIAEQMLDVQAEIKLLPARRFEQFLARRRMAQAVLNGSGGQEEHRVALRQMSMVLAGARR